MKFTVADNTVPAGGFTANFVGVEEVEHEQYGPGMKFEFRIVGGEHHGKSVWRTTAVNATKKNNLGKMLVGLAGHSLDNGAEINVDDYVDQTYAVSVGETESGGTRVESCIQQP